MTPAAVYSNANKHFESSIIISENRCPLFQRLFAFLATFRDGGATS